MSGKLASLVTRGAFSESDRLFLAGVSWYIANVIAEISKIIAFEMNFVGIVLANSSEMLMLIFSVILQ